jgi:hypothetical protein
MVRLESNVILPVGEYYLRFTAPGVAPEDFSEFKSFGPDSYRFAFAIGDKHCLTEIAATQSGNQVRVDLIFGQGLSISREELLQAVTVKTNGKKLACSLPGDIGWFVGLDCSGSDGFSLWLDASQVRGSRGESLHGCYSIPVSAQEISLVAGTTVRRRLW